MLFRAAKYTHSKSAWKKLGQFYIFEFFHSKFCDGNIKQDHSKEFKKRNLA